MINFYSMSESAPLRITRDVCTILSMVCGADVQHLLKLDLHEILSNFYLISKCSDNDLKTIAIYACTLLLRLQKISKHITARNVKKLFIVSLVFACNMLSDLELPFSVWPAFSRCLDESSVLSEMCVWYLKSIHWNLHIKSDLYNSMLGLISSQPELEPLTTPRIIDSNNN
ncbi:hypothetical protein QR46_2409 [Giardia duodenalis assemblage B]|uniref:Cyclin N-terminal domain-containing protein n=2 Tax=Giardia intestinalis TaxID=5741 RepID=A0A132NU51_GIAIN|nr:Hypothetical protein GSB_88922 [Giardia intestinalis]KWX13590.1 hypothetical protein QR46_2409 [Giardia intestinalis assemblage B]